MPNTIQLQELLRSTQGVVEWEALYTILRNPNGNRYVLYLYWNDGKWNWNYNWLGNEWNVSNQSAVLATMSFLKADIYRLLVFLFCLLLRKLPMPSTQHSPYLIKRKRNSNILFIIYRLTLPEYEK